MKVEQRGITVELTQDEAQHLKDLVRNIHPNYVKNDKSSLVYFAQNLFEMLESKGVSN